MNLQQSVYQYYLDNQRELTPSRRFHFATRMTAWLGTPDLQTMLREASSYIAPEGIDLTDSLKIIYETPQRGRRKAHELRAPYFEKYPDLYGIHQTLFRVRYLKELFGIDARQELFSIIPKEKLLTLRDQLLSDSEALMTLSTFAVNYCYLLENLEIAETHSFPLTVIVELDDKYDMSNMEHIQLLIYLYTHCIISDTNFYVQPISRQRLPVYTQMLRKLERIIENNFSKISLDNKLEFLVCARICSFDTTLFERIYDECEKSVSPDGTFLIDVHNENINPRQSSLSTSEHRNVLFIMSGSSYTPHRIAL